MKMTTSMDSRLQRSPVTGEGSDGDTITVSRPVVSGLPSGWWRDPGLSTALALLLAGSCVALTVDVPRTLLGIKGDEATYVAMALSLAYDADLVYEAADESRFFAIYSGGPEGIYLKDGVRSFVEFDSTFPFVHRGTYPDGVDGRFYFGKAYISSVFAAPLVWLAGVNGLLWLNVVLLAGVVYAGYRFVAARAPSRVALSFILAFVGASITPLWVVWLSPEVFNFSVVFFAYFLWFYKDVAGRPTSSCGRWLRGPSSDLVAAVLLGLVIFSKPWPHPLFVVPPVVHLWRQRRFGHGLAVGFLAASVSWAALGLNAAISGEFVYQGGLDRKYVVGEFPFEPGADWDELGVGVATNEIVVEDPLGPIAFLTLLFHNLRYFLLGRHFGFIPFFFPGVVVVWLLVRARREVRGWQWMTLGTVVAAAVTLAIYMPFTWSGGGGPSGNRYYLSTYPLFLFLIPPLQAYWPTVMAGLGGMVFIGHILVNPFVSAKQPYLAPERGLLRSLPVELTTVLDLPIMLDASRARVLYGNAPRLQLYLLDRNASLPEPPGVWIYGDRRADIIVRTPMALETITVTATSPVATEVSIEIGRGSGQVMLEPDVPGRITVTPSGVYSRQSWAYLLQVSTKGGFVPRLVDVESTDSRFLGAAITLSARPVSSS